MGEIFLDHERVLFDGPEPADAEALFNLLNRVLGEQGRCIVRFDVDGGDYLRGQVKPDLRSFDRVEVISSPHCSVLGEAIAGFLNNNDSLSEELTSYGAVILAIPWSKVVARIEEFSEKMKPLQEILEVLLNYGKEGNFVWLELLEDQFRQLERALEKFLESAARGDVGEISDILVFELSILVKALCETLAGPVSEDLLARTGETAA